MDKEMKELHESLIDLLTVISIASDDGYDFPPTSRTLTAKADKIAVEFCMKEARCTNSQ